MGIIAIHFKYVREIILGLGVSIKLINCLLFVKAMPSKAKCKLTCLLFTFDNNYHSSIIDHMIKYGVHPKQKKHNKKVKISNPS